MSERGKEQCPVCRCYTLEVRYDWEICPVCFWEDDVHEVGRDPVSPANRGMRLSRARENYLTLGAIDERCVEHTRDPLPDELPPEGPP